MGYLETITKEILDEALDRNTEGYQENYRIKISLELPGMYGLIKKVSSYSTDSSKAELEGLSIHDCFSYLNNDIKDLIPQVDKCLYNLIEDIMSKKGKTCIMPDEGKVYEESNEKIETYKDFSRVYITMKKNGNELLGKVLLDKFLKPEFDKEGNTGFFTYFMLMISEKSHHSEKKQ